MLAEVQARLGASAEHSAAGHDVDRYLDQVAAEALVALYPGEVDLQSIYDRRRRMSEHVVDALVEASLALEGEVP